MTDLPDDHAGRDDFPFPGYHDVVALGSSRFPTMFTAVDDKNGRAVALHLIRGPGRTDEAARSFRHDLKLLGTLNRHPNIVQLYRVFKLKSGETVLALQLCRGPLTAELDSAGRLDLRRAASVGISVAGALDAAHSSRLYHRDVRPERLMLSFGGVVSLDGFALVHLETGDRTIASGSAGFTAVHAAPELLEGKDVTGPADVYSLASSLYALAAGMPAFTPAPGEVPFSTVVRIIHDEVPPLELPDVRPEPAAAFFALLLEGLAKNPYLRPNAREFATSLQEFEAAQGWEVTAFATLAPSNDVELIYPDRVLVVPPDHTAPPLPPALASRALAETAPAAGNDADDFAALIDAVPLESHRSAPIAAAATAAVGAAEVARLVDSKAPTPPVTEPVKPAAKTPPPVTEPLKPAAKTPPPVTEPVQPAAKTPPPVTEPVQPAAKTPPPVTEPVKSAAKTPPPVTEPVKPAAKTPPPITEPVKPAAKTPPPITEPVKPAAKTPPPITEPVKPAAKTPPPVTEPVKPAAKTPPAVVAAGAASAARPAARSTQRKPAARSTGAAEVQISPTSDAPDSGPITDAVIPPVPVVAAEAAAPAAGQAAAPGAASKSSPSKSEPTKKPSRASRRRAGGAGAAAATAAASTVAAGTATEAAISGAGAAQSPTTRSNGGAASVPSSHPDGVPGAASGPTPAPSKRGDSGAGTQGSRPNSGKNAAGAARGNGTATRPSAAPPPEKSTTPALAGIEASAVAATASDAPDATSLNGRHENSRDDRAAGVAVASGGAAALAASASLAAAEEFTGTARIPPLPERRQRSNRNRYLLALIPAAVVIGLIVLFATHSSSGSGGNHLAGGGATTLTTDPGQGGPTTTLRGGGGSGHHHPVVVVGHHHANTTTTQATQSHAAGGATTTSSPGSTSTSSPGGHGNPTTTTVRVTTTTQTTTTTRPPPTTTTTPTSPTVLTDSGDGNSPTTQSFTITASSWEVRWSFSCYGTDPLPGSFSWTVNRLSGAGGTLPGASEVSKNSGSGVYPYSGSGTFDLAINSSCHWSIQVTQ